MAYLVRLSRFLYDFLVGEAPELFIGPLVALAVAWGLLQLGLGVVVAGASLVGVVLIVVAVHVTLALRHAA